MTKRSLLTALVLAMGLGLSATAPAARASSHEFTLDQLLKMGDRNNDRMLNRQEFIEAMGKAYDQHMTKLKKMQDAAKYMKGDAMTRDGLKMLFDDVHEGA